MLALFCTLKLTIR
jgi:hypothetical protein